MGVRLSRRNDFYSFEIYHTCLCLLHSHMTDAIALHALRRGNALRSCVAYLYHLHNTIARGSPLYGNGFFGKPDYGKSLTFFVPTLLLVVR